jgi:hypothetical protein
MVSTFGGGVAKVHVSSRASACPFAARAPAGTLTVYSVAIGKRLSGSKTTVCAPTQRHLPFGSGVSTTGGGVRSRSATEVTATIGSENETLRKGAISTLPAGARRVIASGAPAACAGGGAGPAGGGNGSAMVLPGRGGGCDRSRSANDCSSEESGPNAGSRSSTRFASASESGVVLGRGVGRASRGSASLTRKPRPFFEGRTTTGSAAGAAGDGGATGAGTSGQPAASAATTRARTAAGRDDMRPPRIEEDTDDPRAAAIWIGVIRAGAARPPREAHCMDATGMHSAGSGCDLQYAASFGGPMVSTTDCEGRIGRCAVVLGSPQDLPSSWLASSGWQTPASLGTVHAWPVL